MRSPRKHLVRLSVLKRTPISLTTRTVDEILVISVTGAMTEKGGVDALLETATEAVQSSSRKILLELAPTYWDSNGLLVLGRVLDRVIQFRASSLDVFEAVIHDAQQSIRLILCGHKAFTIYVSVLPRGILRWGTSKEVDALNILWRFDVKQAANGRNNVNNPRD